MKFDTRLRASSLASLGRQVRDLERDGVDAIWVAERDRDPFLMLALAASASERVMLGTAVALAFTRSPMVIAQTAWDLQSLSQGRFVLGLGSQVRAHVERRFSAQWSDPVGRMAEVIAALRAIWDCWQNGSELDFRGLHYRFDLMPPAFRPPPLPCSPPPIFLGGVNPGMIKLAGRRCDGFHAHPFHSRRYLSEIVLPMIAEGADEADRPLSDIGISASVLCVTDESSRRYVRRQLSFYASTKAYRSVLALHGWDDVGAALGRMAAAGEWGKMPGLIDEEMIDTFALVGSPQTIRETAERCYDGLAQRLTLDFGPERETEP